MKKKLIVTLTALLVLSNVVPMTVYAKEVTTENLQTDNNDIDMTKLKEDIKEKANLLMKKDKKICAQYTSDSVQYAISDGDNIIISDNVADSNRVDNTVANDSMYGIGSISKMFTTTAVMQLVDEKKIDLDLPVVNYIPDFKMKDTEDKKYETITPRMLLNHSSGIGSAAAKDGLLLGDTNVESYNKFLENLREQELLSKPGQYSAYSNGGFLLAQLLVERVSNMSFPDYIEKNIASPLGLKHTKTPKDINDLLAKTYSCSDGFMIADKDEDEKDEDYKNTRGTKEFCDPHETPADGIGTAGIFCSAEDLCKFGSNLVKKDGNGLLSPRSVELMGEKEYLKGLWVDDPDGQNRDNDIGYGLGWDCVKLYPFNKYGIKAYVKHGSTLFYNSCLITLPELNITMATSVSGGSSNANEAFAISALLDVLKSKGIIQATDKDIDWKEEKSQSMPSNIIDEEGEIYNYGSKTVKVETDKDGTLTLTDPQIVDENKKTKSIKFYYTNSGYFMRDYDSLKGTNLEGDKSIVGIKFVTEENGKKYMEQKSYKNFPGLSKYADDCYVAEKVEGVDDENLKSIWGEKLKEPYYILNAKYSSAIYAGQLGYGFGKFNVDDNGYINGSRIEDESNAKVAVQIPGRTTMGLANYEFRKDGETDYLNYNGAKFINGGEIDKNIITSNTTSVKIGDDGYTKWFKVHKKDEDDKNSLVGKTITVTCNGKKLNQDSKAAFCVYSSKNKCVNDSYVSGSNSVPLKEGDVIAFVGNPGDEFTIDLQ